MKDITTRICIDNLRLRAIIGIFEWERKNKQDLVLNIQMDVDVSDVFERDDVQYTLDYKTLTKTIIDYVETSEFMLIEKLAYRVLGLVMGDARVKYAVVRIDKPQALRFADSVGVEVSAAQ